MKRRQERVERAIKVYVLSKAVRKSIIFRTVLLSDNSTMEDVWNTYQITSLQPTVLADLLKQRSNLQSVILLPRERSVKVCACVRTLVCIGTTKFEFCGPSD